MPADKRTAVNQISYPCFYSTRLVSRKLAAEYNQTP